MYICDYGCGQEANYKFKNSKWCCSKSYAACPFYKQNRFSINANNVKAKCKFCDRVIGVNNIKRHVSYCYLNLKNLKLCPVCDLPIENYKTSTTCSYACSNSFFRSGENNPNWQQDSYTTTCFLYHSKQCIICKEINIVAVHHYDNNKANNNPENLVPMCPTHHQYMHSRFKHLIKDIVDNYVSNFKISGWQDSNLRILGPKPSD